MAYKNIKKQNLNKRYAKKKERKRVDKPKMLPSTLSIGGSQYAGTHHFSCGNDVAVYEVHTVHALNQMIGHAKFNNQSYGNVYYRGECKLHSSLKPSLFRKGKNAERASERISQLIQRFVDDTYMKKELKIVPGDYETSKYKIEGMLQHYGVPTRFIDVVDNHWIALWMGLNQVEKLKQYNQYYHYVERSIPLVEFAKGDPLPDDLLFQYILLIAVPFSENRTFTGIQSSSDYIEVDLRQALPSTFLRPHAQHGFVLRRKVHQPTSCGTDAYDMAPAVIGIIKIRIDKVREWMGNGTLLSQNNLFPPPAYDYGYDLLLSRNDLFKGSEYSIARYV
ncbi:MAG: FRG domain-containing protein [Oscillospiraceae bacterium]|jgi:hypothetical protein|nr:FRG domain-containing protein [Oscillospiraceae bacterium]